MVKQVALLTGAVGLSILVCQPTRAQVPTAAPRGTLEASVEKLRSDLEELQSAVRQKAPERTVERLRSDLDELERDLSRSSVTPGVVMYLFGFVCALWAQNTGRNPWLWFFAGAVFSVFSALVVLYKNSEDRARTDATSPGPP